MATIPAGNDPFIGGSITRSGQSNVAGGIASANTSVGNPIGGVNPGTIFSARNNSGSNIGIPYTRLVPLGSKSGSGLAPPPLPAGMEMPPANGQRAGYLTETEDLRSMTVAFILGKRSGPQYSVNPDGEETFEQNIDYGFSLAVNGGIVPGMPGTERFQKLCSIEYIRRYFSNALWAKGIVLKNNGPAANAGGTLANKVNTPLFATGLPRMVKAAAAAREENRALRDEANARLDDRAGVALAAGINAATLTNMPDLGKNMGLPDSAAAIDPTIRQGIFAHDMGPFLRGKGITHEMLAGTKDSTVQGINAVAPNDKPINPYHVSRCAGDELAFALFERLLEEKGFSDWRPDGIVLSKGADDPSDKLSDEMLKSRDGELFNIRIQGPAVTSSWTGDPALEVMPLDKVFVVIVADVWWGDFTAGGGGAKPAADAGVSAFVDGVAPPTGVAIGAGFAALSGDDRRTALRAYLAAREKEFETDGNGLCKNPPIPKTVNGAPYGAVPDAASYEAGGAGAQPGVAQAAARAAWGAGLAKARKQWFARNRYEMFQTEAAAAYQTGDEMTRLCNFQVRLATSSQMVNYSYPRFDGNGNQVCSPATDDDEYRRVHNQSRMGLRLGMHGGEYIVGGWCIGSVLDTAASRAAFSSAGANIGVRTAPNSMAINLVVKVEWWDSDRMWRSFMNVNDSLTPRYVKTKPLVGLGPDDRPDGTYLYSGPNMPPKVGTALRKAYAATVTDAEAGPLYDALDGKANGDYAALVAALGAGGAGAAALVASVAAKLEVAASKVPCLALA